MMGKSVLQKKFTLDARYTKNVVAVLRESNSLIMADTDYRSVVEE